MPTSPRGVPHGLVGWNDRGEAEGEAGGFGDELMGRCNEMERRNEIRKEDPKTKKKGERRG